MVLLLTISDVSNFNAKIRCMKCLVNGVHYDAHGVVFPSFTAEPRTDEAFRSKAYGSYHHGETPLTKAIHGLNMIDDVPIGDELHLIDLGCTKRMLKGWIDGELCYKLRFSTNMRIEMSNYLKSIDRPSEIHRAIRGIDEIAHWKGTEFRTFLLYVSIVILKKFLPKKYYQHFLLYFCSITICSTQYHIKNLIEIADQMLKSYLNIFKIFYGPENCVSNIHNLCHLVDEVRRFGSLISFSSYPFETKVQFIKKQSRSGHLPLSQVAKRLIEQENILTNIESDSSKTPAFKKKIINFDLMDSNQFRQNDINEYSLYGEIQLSEYKINNSDGNKYILTKNFEIVETKFIIKNEQNGQAYIYGSAFKTLKDFFEVPIKSRGIHIFTAEK